MIAKLLDLFNPLSWLQKLASITTALLLVFLLGWWFWSALGDHFTDAQNAEYAHVEIVTRAAKQQREALNEAATQKAKDAKIETLKAAAADNKRLSAAYSRLQDDLRASRASQAELPACLQRADSLDKVQRTVGEFAKRVVGEADKHVADKIECAASWPK